ncbi:MAG: hypothetical protein Q8N23_10120 [Archangium sp.]|nr:hypothetical protein [Archangium sp.]MDP3153015.1 hypothetical protein [Archangium sp.]MDP3572597.1 hypothetical protein [Archangium sp.]
MNLKRLLGAENGWGGAAGTVLLLGFGLFVLFISVADLREASRIKPVERGCTEWLADPSGARWVTLVGCKLDLTEAASRKWKGWRSMRDGGVSGEHYIELFIPLFTGEAPVVPPRGVVATTDKELLTLMDGIDRLASPEEVEAYLEINKVAIEKLLEPKTLTGYVEPVKSVAARSALGVITAEDAVVLEQGRQPPRMNALFGLVIGLIAVALVVRSMFMRYLVDRDSSV